MDKRPFIKDCLGQYLESDPDAHKKLAQFCDTSLRSVKNWGQDCLPGGPTFVKLVVYLISEAGLQIEGYDKKSLTYTAMEMIARGKTTANEINQSMGYNETYEVYRFMSGVLNLSSFKEEKLRVFLLSKQFSNPDKSESARSDEEFLKNFAALSGNLSSMETSLDNYLAASPAVRQALREKMELNGTSFFKTSNNLYRILEKLNRLCSEKSMKKGN